MALKQRRTVTHNRGDVIIEAGNIKFGLEFRELRNDRGMAIHVLSDVAGQEIELLAFDCFERGPHYHYGPRNQDVRLYWDMTAVPDTLEWTLDQFKSGKLPAMIARAGYPGVPLHGPRAGVQQSGARGRAEGVGDPCGTREIVPNSSREALRSLPRPFTDPLDEPPRFCYDVPGQMPTIPRMDICSSASVVKPRAVW
jgi:hypothetical protein